MVNSCPLVSPCLYGVKILQPSECCPTALTAALCDSISAVCNKVRKEKSRPLLTVLDSYSTGNEIWQWKMSPLAVSRSKIRIKGSSTLITQHSELLSAALRATQRSI